MTNEQPNQVQEIHTLKSDIATLSSALATSVANTPSENSPPTPRWLSLSNFHSRSQSWEWQKDLNESVIVNRKQKRLPRRSTDHSINLDGSTLGDSEELEDDPVEAARMRMVTVLRSYLFNLSESMLVTGDKVDVDVAQTLIALIKGKEIPNERKGKGKIPDLGLTKESISDEEAVVSEIEEYGKCLMKAGKCSEVPQTVVELAKKIIDWGNIKGFTERQSK